VVEDAIFALCVVAGLSALFLGVAGLAGWIK